MSDNVEKLCEKIVKLSTKGTQKLKVMEELAELICSTIDAELIFTVGRVIVIYKKNKDRNKYEVK